MNSYRGPAWAFAIPTRPNTWEDQINGIARRIALRESAKTPRGTFLRGTWGSGLLRSKDRLVVKGDVDWAGMASLGPFQSRL